MAYQDYFSFEMKGHVGILRLCRPDRLNTVNYDWYNGHYYGSSYYGFDDYGDAFEYSDYYVEPSSDNRYSNDDDDDDDWDIFDSWDSSDTDWSSDW